MSAAKHTPGPWVVLPEESGRGYIRVRGGRLGARYKIANVCAPIYDGSELAQREDSESRANARLIAAAPDLLSALQVVVEQWTAQFERRGHLAPPWCKQARTAIAKATGGPA